MAGAPTPCTSYFPESGGVGGAGGAGGARIDRPLAATQYSRVCVCVCVCKVCIYAPLTGLKLREMNPS